jgi:uncharacterized membrane protein
MSDFANIFEYIICFMVFVVVVGGALWLWLDVRGTLKMMDKDPEQ